MTEPNVSESLLAKIRALLAKAEDPAATPAEAEAFTGKAAEFMARYGIERAMLADADPGTDTIGEREIVLHAPYARDKRDLLVSIAHALGGHAINRQRGTRISAALFGFDSDLDRVETLFTSLLVQAAHALAVTQVPWYDNLAAFRRTWYAGYSDAVYRRLKAAEEQARTRAGDEQPARGGRSTELVLIDRATQIEEAWKQHTAGLPRARGRQLSGSGGVAGYRAGQRADLGGRKVGTRGRRAIGGAR